MANNKKRTILPLIVALAIPLAVGGLASVLTSDQMRVYETMNKPPLAPPGWLFPVVWTALYLMMGLASYLIWSSDGDENRIGRALLFYGLQLVMNFFWTLIFFDLADYALAFVWIVVLWTLILLTTVYFWKLRPGAGVLMLPYLLWVTFASYLTYATYQLSITPMPILTAELLPH